MKLQTIDRDVTSSGLLGTNEFTIATNAKSFKVISDSLYTNKPLAILREYLNNAWDSHIDAGKEDVPVYLHLPTQLEPWLEITDEGIGLDDEQVRSIYTSYFTSTKENSNDYNGCLGLGSKSAFSYTDSFVVVARKMGMERTYSLYLNADGIPTYSLLSEKSDVVKDGVTIKVNIKRHDTDMFHKEARKFLENYSGLVKINLPDFQYARTEYTMEGTNWKLRKTTGYPQDGPRVIMGSVVYPVDRTVMEHYLTGDSKQLLGCPLDITVPLGQVSIHPSREGLDYDDLTTSGLKRILDDTYKDIQETMFKDIEASKTEWGALQTHADLKSSLPHGLSSLLGWQKFTWKGNEYNYRLRDTVRPHKGVEVGFRTKRSTWGRSNEYQNSFTYREVDRQGMEGVIIVDKLSSYTQVLKYHLGEHDLEGNWIVLKGTKETTDKEYKDTIKWLGNPKTILKVSEMDKPPTVKGTRKAGRGGSTKVLEWNGKYATSYSNRWNNTEVQYDEIDVYLVVERFKPKDTSKVDFEKQLSILKRIDKLPDVLHGVPMSSRKQVLKNISPDAEEFQVYVKRVFLEYLSGKTETDWVDYLSYSESYVNNWDTSDGKLTKSMEKLKCVTHPVYRLFQEKQKADLYDPRDIKDTLSFLPDFKIPVDKSDSRVYNISQEFQVATLKYPMVQYLSMPYHYGGYNETFEDWWDRQDNLQRDAYKTLIEYLIDLEGNK